MHDARRVGGRQCVRHLSCNFKGTALRQRAAFQMVAQGLAIDQLADDVDQPILAAGVVHGEDVGMVQRACRPRLLFETLAASGVVRHVRSEHLDRYGAAQACVARAVNVAHAARAQQGNDFVGTDPAARG